MKHVMLDGEWLELELTGHRISGMKNWHAVRRLAKAGYLRAVWARGPLRGMEYYLTAAGQGEATARLARVPWDGTAVAVGARVQARRPLATTRRRVG